MPGPAEPRHMDGMADAIARAAVPHAEAAAGRAQEQVLVRIHVIGFDQVMVDVLHRQLYPHAIEAHRLEFEHGKGAEHVLKQDLVDVDGDLGARPHLALNEARPEQLLRNV